MPDALPAATQDRSVATRDLLSDAAEAVLREQGLAGCTIQDVAKRAGRSPGSVYRRFGDKERMIEAVIARYLARTLAANEANLGLLRQRAPDLSSRIKALVDGMIAGQRRDGKLIEAFREAAALCANPAMAAEFERMRTATLDLARAAIRDCAGEIGHRHKKRAIDVAIAMLVGGLDAVIRGKVMAIDDAVLRTELHTMMLRYLTAA